MKLHRKNERVSFAVVVALKRLRNGSRWFWRQTKKASTSESALTGPNCTLRCSCKLHTCPPHKDLNGNPTRGFSLHGPGIFMTPSDQLARL